MLKANARVVVDPKKKRVVAELNPDFALYYCWFIRRYYKVNVDTPMFKPHVSIILETFEPNVHWKSQLKYHGERIELSYTPDIVVGGLKSNFRNFYIMVDAHPIFREIRKNAGIYRKLTNPHITVANTKNGMRDWWPELITIK